MTEATNKNNAIDNKSDLTLEEQIRNKNDKLKLSKKEIMKNKFFMFGFPIFGVLFAVLSRVKEIGAGGHINIGSLSISHILIGYVVCIFFFIAGWGSYRANKDLNVSLVKQQEELKKLMKN